ncbi:MAG TPA: cation transporter [Bacteroidales bacterium]|nr:cation transporter [Bacteroidales bacterium]
MAGLINLKDEKSRVAFYSVIAAILLTTFKIVVGVLTNSLGILSEALHSGLDLVAAVITLFAVKAADKPADKSHNYGHGKVENLSALAETLLLFITCFWIIYEAVHRLITGNTDIEVTLWSFLVVIVSIAIDFSRSRSLAKVAKKHNSQALEADALHFSTDIWSSSVVLIGLIFASFGFYFADPIAALFVALIVIYVSYKLGKKAIDALLDRSPEESVEKIEAVLQSAKGITRYHDLRVRTMGAETLVEMNIHVTPGITIEAAHKISHDVEHEIMNAIERCEVHIHIEPEDSVG